MGEDRLGSRVDRRPARVTTSASERRKPPGRLAKGDDVNSK